MAVANVAPGEPIMLANTLPAVGPNVLVAHVSDRLYAAELPLASALSVLLIGAPLGPTVSVDPSSYLYVMFPVVGSTTVLEPAPGAVPHEKSPETLSPVLP